MSLAVCLETGKGQTVATKLESHNCLKYHCIVKYLDFPSLELNHEKEQWTWREHSWNVLEMFCVYLWTISFDTLAFYKQVIIRSVVLNLICLRQNWNYLQPTWSRLLVDCRNKKRNLLILWTEVMWCVEEHPLLKSPRLWFSCCSCCNHLYFLLSARVCQGAWRASSQSVRTNRGGRDLRKSGRIVRKA